LVRLPFLIELILNQIEGPEMFATNRPAGNHFREFLAFAPTFFLLMAVMQFFTQWGVMRFLMYHSQQVLPADSYNCRVYTAEDYRKLSDRSLDTVVLSDGSNLHRTPAWYDLVLPQIKRVDGDHYIEVTTLGTAYYLRNWLTATMPMAMLCILSLAASVYSNRRLKRSSNPACDPSTSRGLD
jgi:hypothetical protein